MPWRKLRPVKRLGTATDVITVVGLIGGAFAMLEVKGHDWGSPVAVLAGGLAGWLVGYAVALVVRRALSRTCPVCAGKGKVACSVPGQGAAADVCPRCAGVGRIV